MVVGSVLLQKTAHRRPAQCNLLPRRPVCYLEWRIERQIFRRAASRIRFRPGLTQQHVANVPGARLQ